MKTDEQDLEEVDLHLPNLDTLEVLTVQPLNVDMHRILCVALLVAEGATKADMQVLGLNMANNVALVSVLHSAGCARPPARYLLHEAIQFVLVIT